MSRRVHAQRPNHHTHAATQPNTSQLACTQLVHSSTNPHPPPFDSTTITTITSLSLVFFFYTSDGSS